MKTEKIKAIFNAISFHFNLLVSLFLKMEVFLVDQANLELFNNTAIPENVTNYYISQLFEFNPTFNPLKWVK